MINSFRLFLPWLGAVLVAGFVAFGVVEATRISMESAYQDALKIEVERRAIDVTAQTLNGNVMGSVAALGLVNPLVKSVVSGNISDKDPSLQKMLAAVGTAYQASGVFVVGGSGVVLSSWDRGGTSSAGLDIKFRPYFQIAMQGRQNIFAAVSIATGERALYFAAPVYDQISNASPVIGAAVARLGLERVDSVLEAWTGPALLLSPQKVTFASNRSEWVLGMSGQRSPEQLEKLRALRQFGKAFEISTPKLLPFLIDSDETQFEGHRYKVARSAVQWNDPNGDWSLVLLADLDTVMTVSKKLKLGGGTFVGALILSGLFLAWRHRLVLANSARHLAEEELTSYAEKLEQESAIKSFMAKISADLHNADSLTDFARICLHFVGPKVGANYGAFYVLDEDRQVLSPQGGYGALPNELLPVAVGQGLVGQCAKDNCVMTLTDTVEASVRIVWGGGDAVPKQILMLPIAQSGRVMGVIVLATASTFAVDHRDVLGAVLPMVAMNLEILGRNLGTKRHSLALQQQQTQIKETELWYRSIIESAPEGMLVMSEQGDIIIANPQLDLMFGYEVGGLVGRKIEDLVPMDVRPRHGALRDGYMQNGKTRAMGNQSLELRGVRKDGREFPVDVGLSMLPAMGERGLCVCASVRLRHVHHPEARPEHPEPVKSPPQSLPVEAKVVNQQSLDLPEMDPDIFDFEKLGPIYRWDRAKLQKIIKGFIGDAEGKVAGMEQALAQGDHPTIRQLSHGLKGSGSSAGAMRLGGLAANIETLAIEGNAEGLEMLIPLLAPTLTELRDSLSPFLTSDT